jgi:hypothetical protein
MPATIRAFLMGGITLGITLVSDTSSARAQMGMSGAGRSLGGYGAGTITSYYGGTSTTYVPYNGDASGFIPYNRGFGDEMSTRPALRRIPETPIGGVMTAETPIGGASLTGGMGAAPRGGMGMGSQSRPRTYMPFGVGGGMGMGAGMVSIPTSRASGMLRGPSGPGFGYPFRMPPSLTGAGSMSMP